MLYFACISQTMAPIYFNLKVELVLVSFFCCCNYDEPFYVQKPIVRETEVGPHLDLIFDLIFESVLLLF